MKKNVFLVWLTGLILTSCAIPQKLVYLKDMRPEYLYQLSQRPEMKIQPYDRLKIIVASTQPELTAPFSMGVGGFRMSQDGEVSTAATSTIHESGYLVDRQGNIEYPVLGLLPVKGKSKQEVAEMIKKSLRDGRMVPDAIVTVDLLNFKILLVGEVNGVGVMNITDDKITLLEVIIRAGGVTANAAMDEVYVIREDERGYRAFVNDLRTVNLFLSPTYYLQQNDIVYVKPKAPQRTPREHRFWQYYSTILGVGSTILTLLIYMNVYNK